MNTIDANRDTQTKIRHPQQVKMIMQSQTKEGVRPTKGMETTDVIQEGKTRRKEATINSRFNTIAVNLQEPMIV